MQKKFKNTRFTSFILCLMLTVAVAFTAIGCADSKDSDNAASSQTQTADAADTQTVDEPSDTQEADADTQTTDAASDATSLGEGSLQFDFTVVDADGNETAFDIHTDADTVGAALLEQNLIAGDDSEYGLYVKTVNGITADYDTDGTYWAFYINGEYAMTGVDSTPVEDGASYTFKVEK